MEPGILVGLTLALFSGTLDGSMAFPMQFASRWRWENIWLVYSIFGMLLIPWIVASLTLANFLEARSVLTNNVKAAVWAQPDVDSLIAQTKKEI